ncbi:MAG TPA: sodium:solute symporter family protein, partial [Bacteroidota bacterium]|nr:sodium:solute symporter family protein [Bacteroidota bacterium]
GFLAKKVRATNYYTIPDKLAGSYDRKTALLGAILTYILVSPAPYVLMLSILLQMIFGWSMMVALVVTALTAVSYLYFGGFRSDVRTNVLEFVMMFSGFGIILPFCISRFGGMEFLRTHLPAVHLTWAGGNSIQYILAWFFIALWTIVDPSFHQRCYAAKDGNVARRGIFISILFWFIFDALTTTAGLYARAALPGLEQPMMSYPLLAEMILPPVAKGMFYVSMLAAIMSTLNSLSFVSAQTLGRDIVMRWRLAATSIEAVELDAPSTMLTRIGLIVSFLLSVLLAWSIPSVVNLWYAIGTVTIPGLLIPLVASYFPRLRIATGYAFLAMLLGWLTSLFWFLARYVGSSGDSYPLGIEPMYPGLVVSLICWVLGKMLGRISVAPTTLHPA